MSVRVLTNHEYLKLASKVSDTEQQAILQTTADEIKHVHRLLCEGREVEELTLMEQYYAALFKSAELARIDYPDGSWNPGIEMRDPETEHKPDKPGKRKPE